jgi:hypothetical protein
VLGRVRSIDPLGLAATLGAARYDVTAWDDTNREHLTTAGGVALQVSDV